MLLSMVSRVLWGLTIRVMVRVTGSMPGHSRGLAAETAPRTAQHWPCNPIAGLHRPPVHAHKQNNLPANQKGYDKSETTYEKLLARRIQIYWDYFCVIKISPLFQNNVQNNAQTKIVPAESDSSRQTFLCRGLRSFWGASVWWWIDFIVFLRKSSWYACARSTIACSQIPTTC